MLLYLVLMIVLFAALAVGAIAGGWLGVLLTTAGLTAWFTITVGSIVVLVRRRFGIGSRSVWFERAYERVDRVVLSRLDSDSRPFNGRTTMTPTVLDRYYAKLTDSAGLALDATGRLLARLLYVAFWVAVCGSLIYLVVRFIHWAWYTPLHP